MEDTSEDRNLLVKVLRPKTKALICDLLKPQMFLGAPNGTLRYWKGLAGLCQIDSKYEASLDEDTNPANRVLNLWCERDPQQCTIQQLLFFLEEMDRFDIIADVIELIDEDIRAYRENPRELEHEVTPVSLEADKYIITTDDVRRINEGLALETYDAFLLYDQDDIDFATQLLEIMEKDYNMRFCVKDRDLVGGGLEMDKVIRLITERCNRLVVILSDSFFKSSANDYYLSFAQAYGIECQRKIIPCVYKDLSSNPAHMKFLFTLDYRRMLIFNFWDKLRDSIQVGDAAKLKMNRSRSHDGNSLKSALHENATNLKPLQHAVKFNSSVGDLNSLDTVTEPSLNASTSADNLGPYPESKKEKKLFSLFRRKKKEKSNDCLKIEKEKNKGFRKHLKRTAAVAN